MSWAQLIGSSQSHIRVMILRKEWIAQSNCVSLDSSWKLSRHSSKQGRSGYGCGTRSRNCSCDCHVPRLMSDCVSTPVPKGELGPHGDTALLLRKGSWPMKTRYLVSYCMIAIQSDRRLICKQIISPRGSPMPIPNHPTQSASHYAPGELAAWTRRVWRLENQFESLLPNSSLDWYHLCSVSDSDGFATHSAPPPPHSRP